MTFPAYPAYKNSGVEWQGDVPAAWPRSALKYLADYQNGYPFKPEDWGEEGLPIIRISQLTGDTTPNYYSGELDDRVKVNDGDLLFSWSATIDSFIWEGGTAWLNQHIFKVSLTEEADQKFLFYLIKLVAPKLADFDAHGSTMRHIKKESLSERLHVPTLEEQTQIARFLDHETARIDALIAEQQRLIELLKEKRQAVISHAVTKGLDPTVPMKDSGVEWLGEVPAHWEVCKLSIRYSVELGKMLDEKRNTGANPVPYLRNQDVQWGVINIDDLPLIDIESSEYERYTVKFGDLLVCEGGDVGRAAIWRHKDSKIGYQKALHRLRPKSPNIDTEEFFFYSLMAAKALGVFDESDTKATISHLPAEKFRQYKFAFPPSEVQQKIASVLGGTLELSDVTISNAESMITLLQERRSALISAAVTGKIDVRDWQAPAEKPADQSHHKIVAH